MALYNAIQNGKKATIPEIGKALSADSLGEPYGFESIDVYSNPIYEYDYTYLNNGSSRYRIINVQKYRTVRIKAVEGSYNSSSISYNLIKFKTNGEITNLSEEVLLWASSDGDTYDISDADFIQVPFSSSGATANIYLYL